MNRNLGKNELKYLRDRGVVIGRKCRIHGTAFFDRKGKLVIGDEVVITRGTTILTHDATAPLRGVTDRPCTVIEDRAFIGIRAIILSGLTIGERAIIGAGAVVTKDVPAREIWAGNPAKKIGEVT